MPSYNYLEDAGELTTELSGISEKKLKVRLKDSNLPAFWNIGNKLEKFDEFVTFLYDHREIADGIIELSSCGTDLVKREYAINALNNHFDDFVNYSDKYGIGFVNVFYTHLQYADDIITLCKHGDIEFIEKMEEISSDDFALRKLDDFKNEVKESNELKKSKNSKEYKELHPNERRYSKVCIALDTKNPIKYGRGVPGYHSKNDYIFGESEKSVNAKKIIGELYENDYHKKPNFDDPNFNFSEYYDYSMSDEYLYQLKEKDYFEKIGRSYDEVKADMAKLRKDIEKTKKAAYDAKKEKNRFGEYSFRPWSVENCAEVWSVRQAIMEGADYDNIAIKCIYTETGECAKPCNNCDHTFAEKLNLWEKE